MDEMNIRAGSKVMVGAPANPLPPEVTSALATAAAATPGVREAHLPQMYIAGFSTSPGQALVLVLEPGADVARVMEELGRRLDAALPNGPGAPLDILPLEEGNELLEPIRAAGCRLFDAASRPAAGRAPWWKLWH